MNDVNAKTTITPTSLSLNDTTNMKKSYNINTQKIIIIIDKFFKPTLINPTKIFPWYLRYNRLLLLKNLLEFVTILF